MSPKDGGLPPMDPSDAGHTLTTNNDAGGESGIDCNQTGGDIQGPFTDSMYRFVTNSIFMAMPEWGSHFLAWSWT